jgi:hypothetical protein
MAGQFWHWRSRGGRSFCVIALFGPLPFPLGRSNERPAMGPEGRQKSAQEPCQRPGTWVRQGVAQGLLAKKLKDGILVVLIYLRPVTVVSREAAEWVGVSDGQAR